MGGSTKTRTDSSFEQQQNQQSQLGSTPYALDFLPRYVAAGEQAANMGAYTGDVVAAPTQASAYAPTIPTVSGFVADPGAPLDDYTPDVQILDRYIAGANPTNFAGLDSARDWATNMGGQVQGTAASLSDYWNRVSAGEFLDPNTNMVLQDFLNTMSEGTLDVFNQGADAFRSQAIDAGAFGGTGYGEGMNRALNELTENDAAARARILYQNYIDENARIERAGGGAAEAYGLGMLPGHTLMGLGDIERGYTQLDINDLIARGQETERGQALDIMDQERRRMDTALREQAFLDDELRAAGWNIYGQESAIRDEVMRNQVDQQIRQGGLANAAARHDATRWGEMEALERLFGGLTNPLFGESSSGEASGTSSSTSRTTTPAWRDVVGVIGAIAGAVGEANGMKGAGAAGANFMTTMMGSNQPQQGSAQTDFPQFAPIQTPNYQQQYFSPSSGGSSNNQIPWYLQMIYGQQPNYNVNPGP